MWFQWCTGHHLIEIIKEYPKSQDIVFLQSSTPFLMESTHIQAYSLLGLPLACQNQVDHHCTFQPSSLVLETILAYINFVRISIVTCNDQGLYISPKSACHCLPSWWLMRLVLSQFISNFIGLLAIIHTHGQIKTTSCRRMYTCWLLKAYILQCQGYRNVSPIDYLAVMIDASPMPCSTLLYQSLVYTIFWAHQNLLESKCR